MAKLPKTERGLRRRIEAILSQAPELGDILRASVIERFQKCGKSTCRCHRGELHGPAYYLSLPKKPRGSRLVYLPARNRDVAERMIENYRRVLEIIAEVSEVQAQMLNRFTPDIPSDGEDHSAGLDDGTQDE